MLTHYLSLLEKGNMFASGIAVDYGASVIVAKTGTATDQGDGTDVSVSKEYRVTSDQSLAPEILIGKRMPSTKVLNQSDARPWHFQELLPSNGTVRSLFSRLFSRPFCWRRADYDNPI